MSLFSRCAWALAFVLFLAWITFSGANPPESNDPHDPMVWVNDYSNIYHRSGSEYYGHTAAGHWERRSEAIKGGARRAYNE